MNVKSDIILHRQVTKKQPIVKKIAGVPSRKQSDSITIQYDIYLNVKIISWTMMIHGASFKYMIMISVKLNPNEVNHKK